MIPGRSGSPAPPKNKWSWFPPVVGCLFPSAPACGVVPVVRGSFRCYCCAAVAAPAAVTPPPPVVLWSVLLVAAVAVAVVAAVCFLVLVLDSQRSGCFFYIIVSFGVYLG